MTTTSQTLRSAVGALIFAGVGIAACNTEPEGGPEWETVDAAIEKIEVPTDVVAGVDFPIAFTTRPPDCRARRGETELDIDGRTARISAVYLVPVGDASDTRSCALLAEDREVSLKYEEAGTVRVEFHWAEFALLRDIIVHPRSGTPGQPCKADFLCD